MRRYRQTEKGKEARARAVAKWKENGGREIINASKRRRYLAQWTWVAALKVERGCIDCGYNKSPYALDFDHRDPTTKRYAIAKRYGQVSDATLQAEIDKCDVRCANCHRERSRECDLPVTLPDQ